MERHHVGRQCLERAAEGEIELVMNCLAMSGYGIALCRTTFSSNDSELFAAEADQLSYCRSKTVTVPKVWVQLSDCISQFSG